MEFCYFLLVRESCSGCPHAYSWVICFTMSHGTFAISIHRAAYYCAGQLAWLWSKQGLWLCLLVSSDLLLVTGNHFITYFNYAKTINSICPPLKGEARSTPAAYAHYLCLGHVNTSAGRRRVYRFQLTCSGCVCLWKLQVIQEDIIPCKE